MTEGRAVEEVVVGVLGGTGPQGRGLAVRLAATGQRVLLGSRDADGCSVVAAEVAERAAAAAAPGVAVSVTGGANADVAGAADLVIVAVPYDGHAELLAGLAGPLAGQGVVGWGGPMGWGGVGAPLPHLPGRFPPPQGAALPPRPPR